MTRHKLFLSFLLFSFTMTADMLPSGLIDPLGNSISKSAADTDHAEDKRREATEMLNTGAPMMPMPSEDQWWQQFHDESLNRLIQSAGANNFQLLSVIKSIRASREAMLGVRAGYYPTIGVSAGYEKMQNSGATMHGPTRSPARESFFNLGADLNWEIDLFGRVAKRAEGARAGYNATRAEYAAMLTSLTAQVATVYFDLMASRSLRATALRHLDSQNRILAITEARLEAGLSSKLDVSQAKSVLLSTRAMLPSIEARIESDLNTLTLLTTLTRPELSELLGDASAIPECKEEMASAIPAELVRRRPDVAEAEYRVAEAAANAGLAKKDWLPTLSLQGSIGTQSHSAGKLFSGNSLSYSIAPTVSWTLFDGFGRKHSVAEAKAELEAVEDRYSYAVATACQEAATAKSDFVSSIAEIEILEESVAQSHETLNLSLDLYKSGLSDFTNVMNAQISWLSDENSAINARNNALSNLMTLYRAMGGGWDGVLPEY